MDIINEIITRRSVKSFKSDYVEDEIIEKVIKAGTFAPSGKNLQSSIIIAITNKQVRDKLSETLKNIRGISVDPFYNAPTVLVVLAKKSVSTHIYDGSCVMENMLLEANSLNIGSCWIHHAKEVFETNFGIELLTNLGINAEEYEGIGHCILGYPEIKNNSTINRKENYVYYIN